MQRLRLTKEDAHDKEKQRYLHYEEEEKPDLVETKPPEEPLKKLDLMFNL